MATEAVDTTPNETLVPYYDFPPFPTVPDGAIIIPFEEFQERGICTICDQDTGEEVDGLGIPTIELKSKHPETDECKSNASKYSYQTPIGFDEPPSGSAPRWWEQWTKSEPSRWMNGKCTENHPVDRFIQAASDFKKYRAWPPGIDGVSFLWDQFQLFSGLVATAPPCNRPKPKNTKNTNEDEDGAGSDFEDKNEPNDENNPPLENEARVYRKKGKNHTPYQGYGKEPVEVSQAQYEALLIEEESKREIRAEDFLVDPGKSITQFLSSYMRKQGLIWADKNLIMAPRLINFFARYMYHTNVLTDKPGKESIQFGMKVAENAIQELPLTSLLSKAIPCPFSVACQQTFGDKGETIGSGEEPEKPVEDSHGSDTVIQDIPTTSVPPDKEETTNKDTEATTPQADPESPNQANPPPFPTILEFDGKEVDLDLEERERAEREFWGRDNDAWPEFHIPNLLDLLGPTALPLTHQPGIVELSVRRIKSISLPPSDSNSMIKSTTTIGGTSPSVEAVELDLANHFAKIVLDPWLNWDLTDEKESAQPIILNSSVGPVVTGTDPDPVDTQVEPLDSKSKPHNPYLDEITILVHKDALQHMRVGMGIWGRWVQLARQQAYESQRPSSKHSGRGKGKKNSSMGKPNPTLWYMDMVAMVFPSFYIP